MSTITLLTSAGAVRVAGEGLVIDLRDIPETPATSSQPVTAPEPSTASPEAPASFPMQEWLPIDGYEGDYEVSHLGVVRRVSTGAILSTFKTARGYLIVKLFRDGKGKNHKVHRLVAGAFLRSPEAGEQVNHKDLDKLNNSVWNLEWCSAAENSMHFKQAVIAGHVEPPARTRTANHVANQARGERTGSAKLSESDAYEIIRSPSAVKNTELAERFGVTKSMIGRIRSGKRWRHLHTHSAPSKAETGRAGGPVCAPVTHSDPAERHPARSVSSAFVSSQPAGSVGVPHSKPHKSGKLEVQPANLSDPRDPGPIPSWMDRRAKKELVA